MNTYIVGFEAVEIAKRDVGVRGEVLHATGDLLGELYFASIVDGYHIVGKQLAQVPMANKLRYDRNILKYLKEKKKTKNKQIKYSKKYLKWIRLKSMQIAWNSRRLGCFVLLKHTLIFEKKVLKKETRNEP